MKRLGEWTLEEVKDGFDRFLEEHGRIPTTPEIDSLDYLPSSRTIQRNWQGVEHLREVLGYDTKTFSTGNFKTNLARSVGVRGREAEDKIEIILIDMFGEVFTHVEKRFRVLEVANKYSLRVDFYVYSPNGNFGVDVFSAGTFRDFEKNVNIKIDKYKYVPCVIYIVDASSNYSQQKIDSYLKTKRKLLPSNCKIYSLDNFMQEISKLPAYEFHPK